jgi:hypothetical protein
MELYIQRSRLTTRLAEQTEQAKAEREGLDVSSMNHMKLFGDHRMFVRMKLEGMNDKESQEEANVAPEAKKDQREKEDEEALYK